MTIASKVFEADAVRDLKHQWGSSQPVPYICIDGFSDNPSMHDLACEKFVLWAERITNSSPLMVVNRTNGAKVIQAVLFRQTALLDASAGRLDLHSGDERTHISVAPRLGRMVMFESRPDHRARFRGGADSAHAPFVLRLSAG